MCNTPKFYQIKFTAKLETVQEFPKTFIHLQGPDIYVFTFLFFFPHMTFLESLFYIKIKKQPKLNFTCLYIVKGNTPFTILLTYCKVIIEKCN